MEANAAVGRASPELRHDHGEDHRHEGAERSTLWVVALTLIAMVGELVVGTWSGSLALTADGWHMGTHAGALALSAAAYWFARTRRKHEAYSFGTGKVYALAGYSNALILCAAALWMIGESVHRFFADVHIHWTEALIAATLGLGVNLVSAWLLHAGSGHDGHAGDAHAGHDHAHDHDHADEHSHDHDHAPKGHAAAHGHGHGHGHGHAAAHGHADHNLRAAYLHVLGDALTSVLAIVALLLGRYLGWAFLDPAMGIVGALVILKWGVDLARATGLSLLDVCPSEKDSRAVRSALEQIDDVRVLDLHVWELGPGRRACIATLSTAEPREIAAYREAVHRVASIAHLTIEVHRR